MTRAQKLCGERTTHEWDFNGAPRWLDESVEVPVMCELCDVKAMEVYVWEGRTVVDEYPPEDVSVREQAA